MASTIRPLSVWLTDNRWTLTRDFIRRYPFAYPSSCDDGSPKESSDASDTRSVCGYFTPPSYIGVGLDGKSWSNLRWQTVHKLHADSPFSTLRLLELRNLRVRTGNRVSLTWASRAWNCIVLSVHGASWSWRLWNTDCRACPTEERDRTLLWASEVQVVEGIAVQYSSNP